MIIIITTNNSYNILFIDFLSPSNIGLSCYLNKRAGWAIHVRLMVSRQSSTINNNIYLTPIDLLNNNVLLVAAQAPLKT